MDQDLQTQDWTWNHLKASTQFYILWKRHTYLIYIPKDKKFAFYCQDFFYFLNSFEF